MIKFCDMANKAMSFVEGAIALIVPFRAAKERAFADQKATLPCGLATAQFVSRQTLVAAGRHESSPHPLSFSRRKSRKQSLPIASRAHFMSCA